MDEHADDIEIGCAGTILPLSGEFLTHWDGECAPGSSPTGRTLPQHGPGQAFCQPARTKLWQSTPAHETRIGITSALGLDHHRRQFRAVDAAMCTRAASDRQSPFQYGATSPRSSITAMTALDKPAVGLAQSLSPAIGLPGTNRHTPGDFGDDDRARRKRRIDNRPRFCSSLHDRHRSCSGPIRRCGERRCR